MILNMLRKKLLKTREYSVQNREEILTYAKQFDWCKILTNYYLPNIEKVDQW